MPTAPLLHNAVHLDWWKKFRDATAPVFKELYESVASGKESQRSIDSNSKADYREKLEVELRELRESEMWQAGKTVRSLRPENQPAPVIKSDKKLDRKSIKIKCKLHHRAISLQCSRRSRKTEKCGYQNTTGFKSESLPPLSMCHLPETGRSAGCAIV